MYRLNNLIGAALIAAPMMGAAAAVAGSADFNHTAWTLAELPGQAVLPEPSATLRLANGRAQGSDGCNRYSTTYKADSGSFHVSPDIASTNMTCAEPVIKQAQAFLGALVKARSARIDNGHLMLLDGEGTVLATLAAQGLDLAGTAWHVTAYNNGKQAVVSVLRGTSLTLSFSPEGKVAGSAGCNRYAGSYSASGEKVSIGQLASTRKMCARPEKIMEQEAAFLKVLEGAAVARLDGNRLELRNADGALMLTASLGGKP